MALNPKLGVGRPKLKGIGYDYAPTIMQQGETTDSIGQSVLDKLGARKEGGLQLYNTSKQARTNRLASDLVNKSAGLKFDEWGKPEISLGNFSEAGKTQLSGIGRRGNLALQTAEAKKAYRSAVQMQDLGSYGFSSYAGSESTDAGTAIPGASSNNVGAKVAAKAIQVMKSGTPYVYGGNSLSRGIDCSGLVQQLYRQLGVNVPRTTYEQAKNGKRVPTSEARPGDLVFYNNYGHVGIYIGNGKIVHAANSKLGVIESNLTNSNGAPLLVLRPY